MTNNEIAAWVAEHVLNAPVCTAFSELGERSMEGHAVVIARIDGETKVFSSRRGGVAFDPFESADDDYTVLKHVSDRWDDEQQDRWGNELHAIVTRRRDPTVDPQSYGTDIADILDYEPGDWTLAAYRAMKGES